jgi:hypothetical protein
MRCCLGWDLSQHGLACALVQEAGEFELVDFECIGLGKSRSQTMVHDLDAWMRIHDVMRRTMVATLGWAAMNEATQFVVAYEQVNFSKSVWWAQLYGGLLATLLRITGEFIKRDYLCLVPINVATAKTVLTGDSGASKARMRMEFDRTAKLSSRIQQRSAIITHDVVDAYAVALAALRRNP